MDGLSVAASVVALAQAFRALVGIIETLRTFVHVGDEMKALVNELATLQALHAHIVWSQHAVVDDAQVLLAEAEAELEPEPMLMRMASKELEGLVQELRALVLKYKNTRKVGTRALFVWNRSKIAQMVKRAKAVRVDLGLAMLSLVSASQQTHGMVLLEVHSMTSSLPGIMHDRFRSLQELITSSPTSTATQVPTTTESIAFHDVEVPPDSTVSVVTEPPIRLSSMSSGVNQPGDAKEGVLPFADLLNIGRILTEAADGDASGQQCNSNYIQMQTSVYPEACLWDCQCRCHGLGTTIRSPTWLQPVLGTLLINYGCVPVLSSSSGSGGGEKCNEKNCARSRSSRVELSYYFPTRVLKRALCFSVEVGGSLGYGAALHLNVPRVFSSYDEAWKFVNFGDLADLRRLWNARQGAYSPLDVNEAGMSLLSDAISRRNTKALVFLIQAWRMRESPRPCDRRAIMLARQTVSIPDGVPLQLELIEALRVIARCDRGGTRVTFSNIHRVIQDRGDLSPILLIDREHSDLNQRDFLGRTPLIHACQINNVSAVESLIQAGARMDSRDNLGQSALIAALDGGHIHCALLLLKAGCDSRAQDDSGRAPLHLVFRTWDLWQPQYSGAAEVMSLLLQRGNVRVRDSYGYTPLHFLVWRARAPVPVVAQVLRQVLDAGPDINAKDMATGAPPMLYAIRARSNAVLRILIEAGVLLDDSVADESGVGVLGEVAASADADQLRIMEHARLSNVNAFLADAKQETPMRKWRRRVRPRKPGSGASVPPQDAAATIPSGQETAAFESLVRDIRNRSLQEDVSRLEDILVGIEAAEPLPRAHTSLARLVEKKTKIGLSRDVETLRILGTQLKEGMWEAATETVHEVVEICTARSETSPWAEDEYFWLELQTSEWIDTTKRRRRRSRGERRRRRDTVAKKDGQGGGKSSKERERERR